MPCQCIYHIADVLLKSCKTILDENQYAASGLYRISPCGIDFTVYCNMEESGGGWTVIQRRIDNTTDFYRTWEDYQRGFGIFESNMSLGLDKIHCLTNTAPCKLLVTLSSFDNQMAKSIYNYFKVGNEMSSYQLHV